MRIKPIPVHRSGSTPTPALKFGQRTPDLQIVVRSARDGAFWRFEVSDNGPGFDASNGHDVFEPFVRLGHAVSGTGLGLSVAKKIVDSHGGAMGVHAAPGEGARFWWTLPMASGGIGISP
ncbi:ATP-binding protein [Aquabacterium sp.]|uniref:sensor histidine kinase n=1 Tax=Aquabacterium sp. TaxID=1872578 RepID=UPI0035ADB210